MDLLPNAEDRQIIDTVAGFLTDRVPMERVRAAADGPMDSPALDERTWKALAEIGLFSLAVPDDLGGAGLGAAEEFLAFREIGRHLTPGPVLATVLAAHLAVDNGNTHLAAEIASGSAVVALAEPFRDPDACLTAPVRGRFAVIDRPGTQYVLAADGSRLALLSTSDLVATEPIPSLEPTARLELVELSGATPLITAEAPALRHRGVLLTAAMLCGIAEATRDQSTSYAATRVQFGQPIGAFQAVKHRCAEMATRAEAATALSTYAALLLDSDSPETGFHAAAARLIAARAATDNAADNVQNHGGMGFTAECDAHLYVRRARFLDQLFGGRPRQCADLLAEPAPENTATDSE